MLNNGIRQSLQSPFDVQTKIVTVGCIASVFYTYDE